MILVKKGELILRVNWFILIFVHLCKLLHGVNGAEYVTGKDKVLPPTTSLKSTDHIEQFCIESCPEQVSHFSFSYFS